MTDLVTKIREAVFQHLATRTRQNEDNSLAQIALEAADRIEVLEREREKLDFELVRIKCGWYDDHGENKIMESMAETLGTDAPPLSGVDGGVNPIRKFANMWKVLGYDMERRLGLHGEREDDVKKTSKKSSI